MPNTELGERGGEKNRKMNIQELEKWQQELKSGRIEIGKISSLESSKLIADAIEFLLCNGLSMDSEAKIEFALKMIKFYDDMEKKFDLAIETLQIEIEGLKSKIN